MLTWLDTLVTHPLGAAIALGAGVALLLTGGYWLVQGSVVIARRFGLSTLLIGLTIVAFGTSAPELAFNLIAATGGHGDLSFGNITGSNIANIGLILGVTGLVCTLDVHSRVVSKELPWLIGISLLVWVLAFLPRGAGVFSWTDGVLLLMLFVVFLFAWKRMGQKDRADTLVQDLGEEAAETRSALWLAIVLFLIGMACLLAGGKITERGAVSIARLLGFSEALIGLSVVAVATSLPELATGLVAARKGHPDLAVGNVVGSNIFNLLFVLGLTTLAAPITIPQWGLYDLGVMIVMTILLWLLARSHGRKILRWQCIALLAIYVGFMTWTVAREF